MGRRFVLCAAAFIMPACNQVLGIDQTRLRDAPPLVPIDAAPPITVVQSVVNEAKKAKTNEIAFTQPITAGNALVVCVYTETATVASVTDTLGTAYNMVVGPVALMSPAANVYIYAAVGVAGGPDAVTVTVTPTQGTTATTIEVYAHELADVVAIDTGAGAVGTSQAPDGASSGAIAAQHGNALIFGFGIGTTAIAAGTNFTTYSTYDNNLTEGLVVTAPGSYAATATSVGDWAMLGADLVGR